MCVEKITIKSLGLPTIAFGLSFVVAPYSQAGRFEQLNLVSDVPGFALNTDPNLVNSWGLVANSNGTVHVANNATGTSTAYFNNGDPFPSPFAPLVINIPGPGGTGHGTPTGIAFNSTNDFKITSGATVAPATYLFATEDGTIAAWNALLGTNAILVVDNSAAGVSVYKGIAIAENGGSNLLYVTNFHANRIEAYDSNFNFAFSFTDPNVDPGFAPFGIRNIDGKLYVTFAKQKPSLHDDQAGPGNGFVDVFLPNGRLLKRLISHGDLNSPWGLAVAPRGFGNLEGRLLVGNFGDGKIHAYHLESGKFVEELKNIDGTPLVINGLWGLEPVQGITEGRRRAAVFFAAGPDEESHGLLGKIEHHREEEEEE